LQPDERQAQKTDIARIIANTIAASAGIGILGRLGLGATRMFNPKPLPYDVSSGARVLKLERDGGAKDEEDESPYPYKDDWQNLKEGSFKKEAVEFNPITLLQNLIFKKGKNGGSGLLATPPDKPNFFKGDDPTGSWGSWGAFPTYAAVPAGLGALYGGYKLTDYILDKRRKAELDEELEDVKGRYDEVTQSLFDKESAAVDVDSVFDELAAVMTQPNVAMTKEADSEWLTTIKDKLCDWFPSFTTGPAGAGLGLAALYALGAGGAAGAGTYKWMNNRSRRNILEEALKRRQMENYVQGFRPSHVTFDDPESLLEDESEVKSEEN